VKIYFFQFSLTLRVPLPQLPQRASLVGILPPRLDNRSEMDRCCLFHSLSPVHVVVSLGGASLGFFFCIRSCKDHEGQNCSQEKRQCGSIRILLHHYRSLLYPMIWPSILLLIFYLTRSGSPHVLTILQPYGLSCPRAAHVSSSFLIVLLQQG